MASSGSISAGAGSYRFEVSSLVEASPAAVWLRIATMAGVNDELWPLVRMTHPPGLDRIDAEEVPLGRPVFRSWLLLFGLIPFDYDDLTFERIDRGRGFYESSRMLSQRRWVHERRLDPVPGGCRVTDRVSFEPKLRFAGPLSARVFRLVFRYRHFRLRRAFARLR